MEGSQVQNKGKRKKTNIRPTWILKDVEEQGKMLEEEAELGMTSKQ
jgi:hypothetical protein